MKRKSVLSSLLHIIVMMVLIVSLAMEAAALPIIKLPLLSNDATLSDIFIGTGALDPVFAPNTTSYKSASVNPITTIEPFASNNGATITINGTACASGQWSKPINLKLGYNTVSIVVTAQDGTTTKTYTITVNYQSTSDASLSDLAIGTGGLFPAFDKNTTSYLSDSNNPITSFSPTASNPGATISVNGIAVESGKWSKAVNLKPGDNAIPIVVTAQDGTTIKTYTVTVKYEINLSDLKISSGTLSPAFKSSTRSYTASTTDSKINITPTATDGKAVITLNGVPVANGSASKDIALALGKNTITVCVLCGTSKTTYSIEVTYQPAVLSNDATLSSLVLSSGTLAPVFAPATTSYTASTTDSKINVTPTATNKNAVIVLNGVPVANGSASKDIALASGKNTITVGVLCGTSKTIYSIEVTYQPAVLSNDATLSSLVLSSGTLAPVFAPATASYTATASDSAIKVTPTAAKSNSTITVNAAAVTSGSPSQAITLNSGKNTVTIVVTAQDGVTKKTYTVDVNYTPALTIPVAPSNLDASISGENVRLTWDDNSSNETGFRIEREKEGGSYSLIDSVSADKESYTDSSVSPNTAYSYRVYAYNSAGESNKTNEAGIKTSDAAVLPANDHSSASSWAEPEITKAEQYKLTTDKVSGKYQNNITREEFCGIAVKLYEALSGKPALPAIKNPFNDTSDADTLKAFELGIVKGVSADSFAPNNNITRQEICVMITRALKAAKGNLDLDTSGVGTFSDESQIADWAINEVRFSSKHGIMKGTGNNAISPLDNTTREQGIVLIKRTYESFK